MNQPLPSTTERAAGEPIACIALRAELDEISRLSVWIDALAAQMALDSHRLYAVQLCLEEVLANVILHARPASAAEALEIVVRVATVGPDLHVTVKDNARAFDPTRAVAPRSPESLDETPIGGLGLKLVRRFSSRLAYNYQDGRNCIALEFADRQS